MTVEHRTNQMPKWAHDLDVKRLGHRLVFDRPRSLAGTYRYEAFYRVEHHIVRTTIRVARRRRSSLAVAHVHVVPGLWAGVVSTDPPERWPRTDRNSPELPWSVSKFLVWQAAAILFGLPGEQTEAA